MSRLGKLSKRELEVAELIAWGGRKSEIATMLFISEDTVENHVRNIYAALDVHSVGQLSSWWFCTHYQISLDLSPLKKKLIALCLLVIILPAEIASATNVVRMTRTKMSIAPRPAGRRAKKELDLTDLFL